MGRDLHDTMRLYLSLMNEARIRFDVISQVWDEQGRKPAHVVREICFLQMRVICEIVALGCLVAHGNESKKLSRLYEADKIISAMTRLTPNFYPTPVTIEKTGKNTKITGCAGRDHLTKTDLAKLWRESGNVLHLAPLAKVLKPQRHRPDDLSDVAGWCKKLIALLENHFITVTAEQGIWVSLKEAETGKPAASVLAFSPADRRVYVQTFKGN
jgi:hypothetical protein